MKTKTAIIKKHSEFFSISFSFYLCENLKSFFDLFEKEGLITILNSVEANKIYVLPNYPGILNLLICQSENAFKAYDWQVISIPSDFMLNQFMDSQKVS